jgi:hypothetical protein
MIQWLLDRWHARQRAIDIDILWPACCRNAQDLDHAKAAFAKHAFHDEAWLCLGENEILTQINRLELRPAPDLSRG